MSVRTAPGAGFTEVAERVWVARHDHLDVNATVVGGVRGLLVVDTLWSVEAGRTLREDALALGAGDVVAVVNTHDHFDHVLGNTALAVPVHAHEQAAGEITALTGSAPDHLFSSVAVVDLGDRVVELVHPGRGHTAGDLVVRVPDADALLAGDLVEESSPPSYGPDCFPLEWPGSLDLVLELLGPDTLVVPGHGGVVDRDFVQQQRADVGAVAETIFDLASRSVPLAEALASADWPLPAGGLADAVRRGYEHVPRTARRLPLV